MFVPDVLRRDKSQQSPTATYSSTLLLTAEHGCMIVSQLWLRHCTNAEIYPKLLWWGQTQYAQYPLNSGRASLEICNTCDTLYNNTRQQCPLR